MMALFFYYVLLNGGLLGVSTWLLVLNRRACWRVPLALVWFGSLGNVAALLHFGYDRIWPTEAVIATGVLALLAELVMLKQPIITHRESGACNPEG